VLKININKAPILALPKLKNPFEMETDSCGYAMGAILMQGGRNVCYHSEIFHGLVLNYPTYDKEIYTMVQDIKKWKHCLMGKETILHTNHM
jgi:hypothetical protein